MSASLGVAVREFPTSTGPVDYALFIEGVPVGIIEAKKTISSPVFFVFSNDIPWCMENLSDLFDKFQVHYVDNNKGKESYRDMHLMSLGRCNILANSSFSWWAAYLNRREDKIVYVPHKWVNNFDDSDAFVDEWIIIR